MCISTFRFVAWGFIRRRGPLISLPGLPCTIWLQSVEMVRDMMSEVWLHFVSFFSCLQFFLMWCGLVEAGEVEDLTWIGNMGKERSKERKEKRRQVKTWENPRHAPEGEEYCPMLPFTSPLGIHSSDPTFTDFFVAVMERYWKRQSYAKIKWLWNSFYFWSNPSKTCGIKDSHWISMAIGSRLFWLLSVMFCYCKNVMGPAWRKVDCCLHRASRNVATNFENVACLKCSA